LFRKLIFSPSEKKDKDKKEKKKKAKKNTTKDPDLQFQKKKKKTVKLVFEGYQSYLMPKIGPCPLSILRLL
jgi:hypothetical protein